MNMQTTSRLTAAEAALIEAFNQQIGELPGNGAVTALRDRLLDDLKREGLPTRRVEAWHYTDLKNLLRNIPAQAGDAGSEALEPLVDGSPVLAVIQGKPDPQGFCRRSLGFGLFRKADRRFGRRQSRRARPRRCGRPHQRQLRQGWLCDRRARWHRVRRAAGNPVRACRRRHSYPPAG